MNLVRQTIRGILWAYTVFMSSQAVTALTTMILARILVPEDFGLIGFAILFLNFMEAAKDFGLRDALVYNDEHETETTHTAFWMNLGIGFLQFGLAFALAPLATYLIDDPRIVEVVRWMSLAFILNALGNTHDSLLQKELEHRKRFVPNLYSAALKGAASIALALLGAGLWSLIAGHLIGALVRTIAKWRLHPYRPRLFFRWERAKSLMSYGIYVLIFDVLAVALDQADQIMIGTLLGATQLGYFVIASKLPEMIIANFSLILARVIFPAYTKIKKDTVLLAQSFLATTQYTAYVTVAAGFGMAAVAPELIVVFFGETWLPATDLLRVLSFLGMTATLAWSAGDVFKAIGRPDISTKLLIVESLYTFPIIWGMASYTKLAVMASLGNLIAYGISVVLRLFLASNILEFSPILYIKIFRTPFFAGFLMYAVVSGWRALATFLSDPVILVTSIALGGMVYTLILWMMERDALEESVTTFIRAMRKPHIHDDELKPIVYAKEASP